MRIRQALLSLQTFPDAVSERVLEGACALAQLLGAQLTVQLSQLNSDRSTWPAVMGAFPVDFPQMMSELVAKSQANAAAAEQSLTKNAADYGVTLDMRRPLTTAFASPAPLVDLARLHDLTILSAPDDGIGSSCLEAVLFGSGRPVVLLPSRRHRLTSLDHIVMAWDYSREAARALADALPLLERAREVRVVTVSGDKHVDTSATRAELEKYLSTHGLPYSLHDVALEGEHIGRFLMDYAAGVSADLLVMGAYGHSRLREFVLGGATREILRDPSLPVFLSH